MFAYDPKYAAVFCKTRDPLGELSNLHKDFPLQLHSELSTVSSENLYQALRFPEHPALQARILAEPRAMGSKRLAYEPDHIVKTTPLWLQGLNLRAMRAVVWVKTIQHQDRLHPLLQQTRFKPIVELSTRDQFWGASPQPDGMLIGENHLGRLWMNVRDTITTLPEKDWLNCLHMHDDDGLILLGKPLCDYPIFSFRANAALPASENLSLF